MAMIDDDKKAAALAAVAEVEAGMLVGLGTGSTAAHAIAALGARVRDGLSVAVVATSLATEAAARDAGLTVRDFADVARVDLTIDGADEVDPRFFAIKGAGGAMLREKIVAAASTRMVVIADGSKRVAAIGAAPVPVEVLPFATRYVRDALAALGARAVVRVQGGEPVATDQGNRIVDCHFPTLADPVATARAIAAIPGALGHGLFLREVDAVYFADGGVVTRLERVRGSD